MSKLKKTSVYIRRPNGFYEMYIPDELITMLEYIAGEESPEEAKRRKNFHKDHRNFYPDSMEWALMKAIKEYYVSIKESQGTSLPKSEFDMQKEACLSFNDEKGVTAEVKTVLVYDDEDKERIKLGVPLKEKDRKRYNACIISYKAQKNHIEKEYRVPFYRIIRTKRQWNKMRNKGSVYKPEVLKGHEF